MKLKRYFFIGFYLMCDNICFAQNNKIDSLKQWKAAKIITSIIDTNKQKKLPKSFFTLVDNYQKSELRSDFMLAENHDTLEIIGNHLNIMEHLSPFGKYYYKQMFVSDIENIMMFNFILLCKHSDIRWEGHLKEIFILVDKTTRRKTSFLSLNDVGLNRDKDRLSSRGYLRQKKYTCVDDYLEITHIKRDDFFRYLVVKDSDVILFYTIWRIDPKGYFYQDCQDNKVIWHEAREKNDYLNKTNNVIFDK